ncbi:MAG TPA: LysE family transporter [Acidimicrobiia bacterium]|nr:LysE family transporter [Acidimicrobiia bacterium]
MKWRVKQFGFRPTVPHVLGTSVGIGSMVVAVAGGLGLLVANFPQVVLALKLIGSVYLLYLAFQVAGSKAALHEAIARPLNVFQAAAFQYLNPKGWIFVLAATTAFTPDDLPVAFGYALVAVTMMVVVAPTSALWVVGGTVINRFVTSGRAHRIMSVVLGLLLALSVAYVWV